MNLDKKTVENGEQDKTIRDLRKQNINPPKAKKPRAKTQIDDDSRPTPTWVPTPAWVEALTLDIEDDE
jgi:hypothetical protein